MLEPGEKREFRVKWRLATWAVLFFSFWAGAAVWYPVSGRPVDGYVVLGGIVFAYVAVAEVLYLLRGPVVVTVDGVFAPMGARKDRYIEWRTVRSYEVKMWAVVGAKGLIGKIPWVVYTRADGRQSRYPISRIKDTDGFLGLIDELVDAYGYRGL